MGKIINIIALTLIIFPLFFFREVYASAWVRQEHSLFGVMEFFRESNSSDNLLSNHEEIAYNINSYKLYLEYGLFKNITFGGYLKNYNFTQKSFCNENKSICKEEIENDFYSNIFVIQNLYNKNKNLFSVEYSFYAPIEYDKLSKKFNTFDTRTSYEFSVLFGRDNNIDLDFINFNYFIDSRLGYRTFNNTNYDRITFEATLGLRLNPTSSVNFYYEYQDHLETDILSTKNKSYDRYTNYNLNQFKISLNYKFLDELSTEFSYFRKFSKTNSSGLIVYFIFNL